MKAYPGEGRSAQDIPAEYQDEVGTARMELIEAAAEGEDALLEKYLEGEDLSADEIARGLREVVRKGAYVPVFVTAGTAEIGIIPLLDAIINLMPSPVQAIPARAQGKDGEEMLKAADNEPFAAYVWKTTADLFVGKITYFRVYAGMLNSDSRVWNQSKGAEERSPPLRPHQRECAT